VPGGNILSFKIYPCTIHHNGDDYYKVVSGRDDLTVYSKDLGRVLEMRNSFIESGTCSQADIQTLKPCGLQHNGEGYYRITIGKVAMSFYNSDFAKVLETRNTFIENGLCSQYNNQNLKTCDLQHNGEGYYRVTIGNKAMSLYSSDFTKVLETKDSFIDNGLCRHSEQ
jgi:hypothetical protein